jgi:hypothetical protein
MLKQLADRAPQRGATNKIDSGRFRQTSTHFGLTEMKDQIIGSKARNVFMSVESLEGIVEVIREEHPFDS